jgi:hypothetical protein
VTREAGGPQGATEGTVRYCAIGWIYVASWEVLQILRQMLFGWVMKIFGWVMKIFGWVTFIGKIFKSSIKLSFLNKT